MKLHRYENCGAIFSDDLSSIESLEKVATISGSPTITNTPHGKGITLDGSSYISINNTSHSMVSSAITLIAWVKTSSSNVLQLIISKGSGQIGSGYSIKVYQGKFHISMKIGSTWSSFSSGITINDGEWHLVVGTYDGTTQRTYVDGVAGATSNVSGDLENIGYNLLIGADYYTGYTITGYFIGTIKNPMVFDRALTEEEIQDIYYNKPFDYDKNIVSHWKLDSDSTSTDAVKDIGWKNLGNDATVYGNPTLDNSYVGDRQCLKLDGTGDYLLVPYDSTLAPSNFTISAWIKPNDADALGIVAGRYKTSLTYGRIWRLFVDNFDLSFVLSSDGTSSTITTTTTSGDKILNGIWYFVSATYDGENMKLYINGELVDSDPKTAIHSDTLELEIGSSDYGVNFNGTIDDVMFFEKALTNLEISDLYKRQRGNKL